MRLKLFILTGLLATSMAVAGQTPAPVLFFSDLILGPNTGNSDTTYAIPSGSTARGVYVELYGNYLSNYSSITLGSCAVTVVSAPATYLWYQRMIVMIGNACSTGNWSITTPGGTWSGPMVSTSKELRTYDFTVVSGSIYFIAASGGSDSAAGTFSAPWASVAHSQATMGDGAVTYIENGYSSNATDGEGGVVDPQPSQCASSTSTQRAMVAYPGATVTLGTLTSQWSAWINYNDGLYCWGYEMAEITMLSASNALGVYSGAGVGGDCPANCTENTRFVADLLECPNSGGQESGCEADGGGESGGGDASFTNNLVLYGLQITNTGNDNTNTLYHGEYHGTTAGLMEGWGYINPYLNNTSSTKGVWDGIQVYNTPGSYTPMFQAYDIHIHDMMVTNSQGHGILMANTDNPSLNTFEGISSWFGGGIELYNNVIWNVGLSGNDNDCLEYDGMQPSGTTAANFYNNTMYACGGTTSGNGVGTGYYGNPPANGCGTSCILNLSNNIDYQTNGIYISNGGSYSSQVTGVNNDLYGVGAINSTTVPSPGWTATGSLNSDPSFVSTSTPNFAPSSSSSPVVGAGSTSGPYSTYDITGLVRPSPPSIGAYEYAAGAAVPPPNPPTKLTAVVN